MEGRSPSTVWQALGCTGSESLVPFPPLTLELISADLLPACGPGWERSIGLLQEARMLTFADKRMASGGMANGDEPEEHRLPCPIRRLPFPTPTPASCPPVIIACFFTPARAADVAMLSAFPWERLPEGSVTHAYKLGRQVTAVSPRYKNFARPCPFPLSVDTRFSPVLNFECGEDVSLEGNQECPLCFDIT